MSNNKDILLNLVTEEIKKSFEGIDVYVFVSKDFLNYTINKEDIFLITHFIKDIDEDKIKNIIYSFNAKNKLNLESEIFFDYGGVYSFSNLANLIKYTPFSIVGDRLFIEKVSNNNNAYCRNRILFFALIYNPKLLYGDDHIFYKYAFETSNTLLKTIFLLVKNKGITLKEIENTIYRNPYTGLSGKNYLGYIKNILEYNSEMIGKLISKNIIKLYDKKYFYDKKLLEEFKIDIIGKPNDEDFKINLPKYKIRELSDFSSNINPFAPSDNLIKKLKFSLNYINIYPDIKNCEANNTLSKFFNIDLKNIITTNGSIESIALIPEILNVKKPGIIEPTFYGFESSMNERLNLKCTKIKLNKENNLYYDISSIEKLASQCDIIYLCNINNPTSSRIDSLVLLNIIKKNINCYFLIEESGFLHYGDFRKRSLLNYIDDLEKISNLSIIYCFSKFFGVAGLRIGALISNTEMIEKFKKRQLPFSLNIIGQIALPNILNDKSFINYTRKNNKATMKKFLKMLNCLPNIRIYDTTTTFVLCELLNGRKSKYLCEKLEEMGFLVRDLSFKEEDGQIIRISVNNDFENKLLISAMRQLLND